MKTNNFTHKMLSAYKKTISPVIKMFFSGGCRFTPTCSEYARDAYIKFGALKGSVLSVKRIIRCNPFNKGACFDPVK